MSLELTISTATLIVIVGGIWRASKWTTQQEEAQKAQTKALEVFAQSMAKDVRDVREDLTAHTAREEKHFEDFRKRHHDANNAITEIRLSQAKLEGEVTRMGQSLPKHA